jgi:hypothetical protein
MQMAGGKGLFYLAAFADDRIDRLKNDGGA